MHDIKFIRENPTQFDAAMNKRGLAPQSQEILRLDELRRTRLTELQELQSKRNQLAKAVGMSKAKGENADAIMAESKQVNEKIAAFEQAAQQQDELDILLSSLPNMPAGDVPEGKDEHDNKNMREYGSKPNFAFTPKEHFDLGETLGLMDFERAASISGSRFVVLKGALARLERALSSFFLDHHVNEFGYQEIIPPFLVRDAALFGTGNLPKFGEDLFKTTTDHYLIPTAEVPLTNLVRDSILDEDTLKNNPLRFTAYTPCFRSEAGSAGKDTRGMIRQHQFSKVEMVSIVHPEASMAEHERMTSCAESLLKKLELPYRVMLLCSGDMGFSAIKTYDIEVWLPGQNAYREISSCSNCGDFQARRMKARFKAKDAKQTQFVHTLNGSGLPIGRTIVAILENYQQQDGSIIIPQVLRSYMGGMESIAL
jgi:seryl-tRNA synthetase